jgi:hypothetical protein
MVWSDAARERVLPLPAAMRIMFVLALVWGLTLPRAFAQGARERDHIAVFAGPGLSHIPGSSDFFGGTTPGENHFAFIGGVEALPFSHVGFQFSVLNTKRNVSNYNGTTFVQSAMGDTFISGEAVFHLLIRNRVSPFLVLGATRESGVGGDPPARGGTAGAGAWIRIAPSVALRPEVRVYVVDLLGSNPVVLSVGVVWHR